MKKLLNLCLLPLMLVCACNNTKNKLNDKTLIIGCSPTPHAEILEAVKPEFEKKGYKLEIKVLQDYVTPNTLLESGDLDANYFQHVPYLDDFNSKNNTHLTWLCKVHFEPMGIYSLDYTELGIHKAKGAVIAVPNDVSNQERAMNLLHEKFGDLLTEYNVIAVEAQALPSVLQDVDYAVINGNYALSAKITDKCIVTEDKTSEIAQTNANVIAIKESSAKFSWCDDLKQIMTSKKVADFIEEKYGSSVIAVF